MLSPTLAPGLAELTRIGHGFFTRQGGVSDGLYGSLNCGLGSADRRAAVLENRARVAAALGTSAERLLTCHQIHSALAVTVDEPWSPEAPPRADALVTRVPGLALGVLAADCAPVLFADANARVIAAAHAGWRGALGGVLEATVSEMERAGARRPDIVAAVGPCISQAAYEVGAEFKAEFVRADDHNDRFFSTSSATGRAHFDLAGFVATRLAKAGIGRVDVVSPCTYADPSRFFSYRRATHAREIDYGRQISAIQLS